MLNLDKMKTAIIKVYIYVVVVPLMLTLNIFHTLL